MISIIIPSFKRAQIISGVVLALKNQTIAKKVPFEILVSVDESDPEIEAYLSYLDQTQKFFKDQDLKIEINVIVNKTKGLVLAKNNAVINSNYQYILMIDDDLYMEDDYVEKLLKDLYPKEVGAVSGFIVTYLPAISHTQPSNYLDTVPKVNHLQTLRLAKKKGEWRSLFGNKEQVMNWIKIRNSIPIKKRFNMDYFVNSYLFKKEVFDKVGGYNPDLNSKTSAHEEVDFTYRVNKAGYKLIFNPHHMMWHLTVGRGGIYKGKDLKSSKKILESEYQKSLSAFISSISN